MTPYLSGSGETQIVLFLVVGLMYVLLDSPRDTKALAILKLLPKSPTQVISLIGDMIRSRLQN